ncbi:restriction endonuclease subunit S [Vibrio cholerae]
MAVENLITEHIDIWTSAVKTKSTSGRGSSKKLELYGVKKLRELILELAVQGKLVPQDPNDEPASVLLKRIAQEKAQLVKEKKLKKPKKLPNISDEEKPFDLPNGWSWIRLNEYGEWGSGSTPKRSNSGYYDGGIPWFKSGELKADYISESEETITELALSETSVRYNNVGDVLVAMYGATIGKTAILSVRATTNQAVCACTPFTGLSNTYLLTLLKAYKARLIGMGAGGAQPNISREKIINTVIALPSTAEQHRIVAKVDELMVLCDQLEQQTEASIEAHQVLVTTLLDTLTNSANADELMQNWTRISEHFDTLFTTEESIDQLKQTILQLAVMGKLVPQDPSDEPAAELLKRIAEEKAQLVKEKKIKKSTSTDSIIKEHCNWTLNEGWGCAELQELCRFIDYRGKNPKKSEQGVRLITAKNIRNGYIKNDPVEYISDDLYKQWMVRGLPKKRDILFITEGHTMGYVAQVELDYSFALAQRTICLQCFGDLSPEYLRIALMSPQFQLMVKDNETGSAAGGIKASKLKRLPIPVPTLPEQVNIVERVDCLLAICEQLKDRLKDSQITQLHLTDAIVEQAI